MYRFCIFRFCMYCTFNEDFFCFCDGIVAFATIAEISRLKPFSVATQTGLGIGWLQTLKTSN